MASCVSCNDGKNKKDVTCCGGTVTETTTKVTKTGGALCEMPTGAVQYIGARYIPVFADPVEWSSDRPYEHLMMVQNQGNTYISKQAVPVGVPLPMPERSNDYWVLMSDWNAQIEQYREEVELFDGRITDNADAIDALADDLTTERDARIAADNKEREARMKLADDLTTERDARIAADNKEREARMNADGELLVSIAALKSRNLLVIGDSWSSPTSTTIEDGIEWTKILEGTQPGINIYNYAVGGSGVIVGGNKNFTGQVLQAANDGTFDNNVIDTIIIQGCINDYRGGHAAPTDYPAELRNLANRIKQNFPNADVYFFFASCYRPKCKSQNADGNWQDILSLNLELCRFINTTFSTNLSTVNPDYKHFKAFNITHCFTEQSFKEWGADNYLFHLSKFGQWQLFKAIMTAISTGETPRIWFNAKVTPEEGIVSQANVAGYYTDTRIEWDCYIVTREATNGSGQTFIALPDTAFVQQNSQTPSRFLGTFTDMFPQTTDPNAGMYAAVGNLVTGWNPLRLMACELSRTRNNTPQSDKPIMFFAPETIYPNADNHGIYLKYGANIPASSFAGHFTLEFKNAWGEYIWID